GGQPPRIPRRLRHPGRHPHPPRPGDPVPLTGPTSFKTHSGYPRADGPSIVTTPFAPGNITCPMGRGLPLPSPRDTVLLSINRRAAGEGDHVTGSWHNQGPRDGREPPKPVRVDPLRARDPGRGRRRAARPRDRVPPRR